MVTRMLIVVHGFEPRGWVRAVPLPASDLVRVLVVDDVPNAAFTSLLPAARRQHRAARAEWRRLEAERTRETVEALRTRLPAADVVRLDAGRAEAGRTIADYARTWHADVVMVGWDTRPPATRALLGTLHEDVVHHAPCAVLVAPTASIAPARAPVATHATFPGGA